MTTPYKVRIADIESGTGQNGAGPCWPDVTASPSLKIIPGDPYVQSSGISSHATAVMGYLAPAAALIDKIYVFNDGWFCGKTRSGNTFGLNESMPDSFDSGPSDWDLETGPFGMYDPLWVYDLHGTQYAVQNGVQVQVPLYIPGILTREVNRLKRDKILALFGPPDDGMQDYPIFCHAVSDNIIRIGTTRTKMVLNSSNMPDVYMDVPYTSYAIPSAAAAAAIPLISWAKTPGNWDNYDPAVLKAIVIAGAMKVNGLPMVNFANSLRMLQDHVSPPVITAPDPVPVPVPPPPPVATPPTPVPQPVTGTGTAPPAPASPAPTFTQLGNWNSAWASIDTPATLYWACTNATSVAVTDPVGVTKVFQGPSGTVTIKNPDPQGTAKWTFVASGPGGTTTKLLGNGPSVHGKF